MADNGNGGVANSDKIAPELFPGISSGLGSSAPGSQGAEGQARDSVETQYTPPTGDWHARVTAQTGGSLQASQDDDGLTPGDKSAYFDTGASGSDSLTDHFGRKPGQQGRR